MTAPQLRREAIAAGVPGPVFDRAVAVWLHLSPREGPLSAALAVRNHAVTGGQTPILRVARVATDEQDAVRRWVGGAR